MVQVFYTPKMVANSGCFSPSAAKPAQVVAERQKLGMPITIVEPEAVSKDQLKLVHEPSHVDAIMSLKAKNGFSNTSLEVMTTLPYTNGSMLSAARAAVLNLGGKITCAPCSGFHHAEYDRAMGYCTFNGLIITAMNLKAQGLVERVGIIDCDQHYGNGTDQLIKQHSLNWINHFTAGEHYFDVKQVKEFFNRFPNIIKAMRGCDLVLYQAGADPHINDPYGGWLTTDELRLRDQIFFECVSSLGIPVAWNLAGGYQIEPDNSIPRVLEIHSNTMWECIKVC